LRDKCTEQLFEVQKIQLMHKLCGGGYMAKRISLEKQTFNPSAAAARLALYAKEKNLTTRKGTPCSTKIADHLGQKLDRRTIGAILKATDKEYSEYTFSVLEERTDIVKEYWMGLTSARTRDEYKAECEQNRLIQEWETGIEQRRQQEATALRILFAQLGYTYRYSEYGDEALHSLQAEAEQEPFGFDETEMEQLLAQMKEIVGYACYKKAIQK
jgi:hypothetical protein